MGAIVFGRIDLGAGGRAAWEAASAKEEAYGPWGEPLDFPAPQPLARVADVLAAGAADAEDPHGTFLEVTGEAQVRVHGVIADDDMDRWLKHVAILAHAAQACGGTGAVWFAVMGGGVMCFSLKKKKKKPAITMTGSEILDSDPELSDAIFAGVDFLQWQAEAEHGSFCAYRESESRFALPDAVTPPERAALAGALALDDAALSSALESVHAREGGKSAKELLGDVASARKALTEATPAARLLAVGLWAEAERAAALGAALAISGSPSRHQRLVALRAIGASRDPAAVRAILPRLTAVGREHDEAARALSLLPAETTDAAILSLLGSPVCDPVAYDDVQPGKEPTDARRDESDEQATLAMGAITAAGLRQLATALPLLLALFEHPHPAALYFRPTVIQALARIGGPEVEKRAESLQIASMGMGLGVNQDLARRAELLHLKKADAKADYAKYDGLDVRRLGALIEERFVVPQQSQNESPSVGTFFEFMQAFPEVTAHGYVIGPGRADYRVSIEGISCKLGAVKDAARRDAIRSAFLELCASANQVDDEKTFLHAWWT